MGWLWHILTHSDGLSHQLAQGRWLAGSKSGCEEGNVPRTCGGGAECYDFWYAETSDFVWIHAYDVGLGTGISAFPYYIMIYHVDPYFPFISMLDPPEPLQRDRNCGCQALNQVTRVQELTRSRQKVGKPHSWRQPKGSRLGLMHFTLHCWILLGNDPGFPFPFLGHAFEACQVADCGKVMLQLCRHDQTWLGRRIKCGREPILYLGKRWLQSTFITQIVQAG